MRYLIVLLFILLSGCHSAPERAYLKDPAKFKAALSACPNTKPAGISCDTLALMHKAIINYGAVLQSNPQAFGERILHLQTDIAGTQQKLAKASSKDRSDLEHQLEQQKKLLSVYMMTVRIYEQPEV